MTCRHGPNDPSCSSYRTPEQRLVDAKERVKQLQTQVGDDTPDASNYRIVRVFRAAEYLALQVQYPSCANCAFEGLKTLVFHNASESQALMWQEIDPHFRDELPEQHQAPSPIARFPGNDVGWKIAVWFALELEAGRVYGY